MQLHRSDDRCHSTYGIALAHIDALLCCCHVVVNTPAEKVFFIQYLLSLLPNGFRATIKQVCFASNDSSLCVPIHAYQRRAVGVGVGVVVESIGSCCASE
jgi:hypothetical protein